MFRSFHFEGEEDYDQRHLNFICGCRNPMQEQISMVGSGSRGRLIQMIYLRYVLERVGNGRRTALLDGGVS